MKKPNFYKTILIALIVISFTFISCDTWVNKVEPITDALENELLDDESQINFLVTGLLDVVSEAGEGGDGLERIMWRNALFSDEMTTRVLGHDPGETVWAQIWPFSMQFAESDWGPTQHPRYLADDLVRRIERIGTFTDNSIRDRALWWGNLIGGIYRMFLGNMWGYTRDGTTPGGVLTTIEQVEAGEFGEFKSTSELHSLALGKLTEALKYDPGDTPGVGLGTAEKIVHSFMARIYLWEGDLVQAKAHAEQGLEQGDSPFQLLHDAQFTSMYWEISGRGVWQLHFSSAPWRFLDYVLADRDEGEIITGLTEDEDPRGLTRSLRGYEGDSGLPGDYTTMNPRAGLANPNERLPLLEDWQLYQVDSDVGYTQDIYTDRFSNFNVIDWREMEMILAEVALQPSVGSSNAYSGSVADFLVHINNVREWHGLTLLTEQDALDFDKPDGGASTERIEEPVPTNPVNITGPKGLLIEERDKNCWLKCVRHMDQRRWGLWHLPTDGNYWPYQPIPDSELIQNPNLDLSR